MTPLRDHAREAKEVPSVFCPSCGVGQPEHHRYCSVCGHPMPVDQAPRRQDKVTALFAGIPTHPTDPPAPVLRVSRYIRDVEFATEDGSVTVPGHHVRISIWPEDRPVCAMSLSDEEAARLGRFLAESLRDAQSIDIRSAS